MAIRHVVPRKMFLSAVCATIVLLLSGSALEAGFFADVGKMIKERQEIRQHSGNIVAGVKELYRERKSIQTFAQSAGVLISAYNDIANKSLSSNFPKLLQIAQAINNLFREYTNLAPKASKIFSQIKPDLKYFSQLRDDNDTFRDSTGKFMVKSLSNTKINKWAGAAGWSRVWETVKDNPMNVFRWGKLRDEYQYGKAEAKYPLKCAQIAFEAISYYDEAERQMQQLLGIRNDINKILGGDLNALLGIGDTINRIQGVGPTVQSIDQIIKGAGTHFGTRFTELNQVQNEYLEVHKTYTQKYQANNQVSQTQSTAATSATAANTATTTTGNNSAAQTNPNNTGYGNSSTANVPQDLQIAMDYYQRAYQMYQQIIQTPGVTQQQVDRALADLTEARTMVEGAKQRAAGR